MTEAEKIRTLIGKTIIGIKVVESWRTNSIDELVITFSDGTSIEMCARTDSGCEECDSDGSNETIISFDLK